MEKSLLYPIIEFLVKNRENVEGFSYHMSIQLEVQIIPLELNLN